LRDIQEEADAQNSKKPKREKTKRRGRSKIQTQLRRKQRNVVDQQILKLRESREQEKQAGSLGKDSGSNAPSSSTTEQKLSNAKDQAPVALKRFF
jgi:hypothetical protein